MSQASGIAITELKVDGGASVVDFMMQLQADHLGVDVLRPRELETTAIGAAYLAGLAKGVWQSTRDISDAWQLEKTFSPIAQPTGYENWQTAVKRSMNWAK
jgi:glycerol kinase